MVVSVLKDCFPHVHPQRIILKFLDQANIDNSVDYLTIDKDLNLTNVPFSFWIKKQG